MTHDAHDAGCYKEGLSSRVSMGRIACFGGHFASVTVFVSSYAILLGCAANDGPMFVIDDAGQVDDSGGGDVEPSPKDAAVVDGGGVDGAGTSAPVDASSLPPAAYDAAKTLAGSYASLMKFRKVISISGSLGSFNALAALYSSVEITADPVKRVVVLTATECHMDLTGTGTGGLQGAMLVVPDAVMTTTHIDSAALSVSSDGGAKEWSLTELHGPVGWKWSSPSDATPTSAGDSRVFDQDMDGNPGVTMHLWWAGTDYPLYYVQAQRDALSGSLAANGELTGVTVDSGDQNLIGGSTSALGGASVSWAADPNTADNSVRMVPVPAPLTCAQLTAQASTLFQ
jgi:hypothetical protein